MKTFVHIVSHWIRLRMRNVSGNTYTENQNTRYMFNNIFFKSYCLWDNVEKYGTAGQTTNQTIIRRTLFSCGINTLKMESLQLIYLHQPKTEIRQRKRNRQFQYVLLLSPAIRSNASMAIQTNRRWLRP